MNDMTCVDGKVGGAGDKCRGVGCVCVECGCECATVGRGRDEGNFLRNSLS